MSDIVYTVSFITERRNTKMGCEYYGSCNVSSGRHFLTKEEKIEMLEDYKERLDQESKGVAERIADLKGSTDLQDSEDE